MTEDEILGESKRRLAKGESYIDISIFLKETSANETTKQRVFNELDRIRKRTHTNKVDISIGKLVVGLPLTIFGTYLIYTGQFSWKSLLILILLIVVGGIISLVEIAKVINNLFRK